MFSRIYRPRIGTWVKVVVPDPASFTPFGVIGQVTHHLKGRGNQGLIRIVLRGEGRSAAVDYRNVRVLTQSEKRSLGLLQM